MTSVSNNSASTPSLKPASENEAVSGQQKTWLILPAAGVGSRMQADRPKQYLSLNGRFLLDQTLETLLGYAAFQQAVLVLAEDDPFWPHSQFADDARIIRAPGGSERCYSVLNGLAAIADQADDNDWVAVHDIARPCLRHSDLDGLFAQLKQTPESCGAILASPTRDTMKRGRATATGANNNSQTVIDHTVEREQLWHALTPQVFRYGQLKQALETCLSQQLEVTDEASALEQMGQAPLLVEGRVDNIKVTRPQDLLLAELFLNQPE